jgi:hypothetical protein
VSTIAEPTGLVAAVSPPRSAIPRALATDQRIVFENVNWELYDRLSDEIGENQHVYLAFDGKNLEVMTKGREHEDPGGAFRSRRIISPQARYGSAENDTRRAV